MDSSLILPLITGSGVAGVFCVLFILGWVLPRRVVDDKDAEIAELKSELKVQRDRADTAVAAQIATRDIISALREGLEMGTARSRGTGDHGRRG